MYADSDQPEEYHPEKLSCPVCQSVKFIMDDGSKSYICTFCGTEIDGTPFFRYIDGVSTQPAYTVRGHFMDAMKRFQSRFDQKKIKNMIDILVEMNHEEHVTRDHLYKFLRENNLSDHYDDINFLYHIITREPCPNISEYEDTFRQQT